MNMKDLILLGAIFLLSIQVAAQEKVYNFSPSGNELSIVSDFPGIVLHTTDKKQIAVTVTSKINDFDIPEMVTLTWDESSNRLKATTDHDKADKYRRRMRSNNEEDEEYSYNFYNYITKLEVYLPSSISSVDIDTDHGKIKASPLPLSIDDIDVHSNHGSIEIIMQEITEKHDIDIHSDHGHVDISIPEESQLDISARTDFGNIYSDLDLSYNQEKKGYRHLNQSHIKATYNGGGPSVYVSSDHADLYIRKSDL